MFYEVNKTTKYLERLDFLHKCKAFSTFHNSLALNGKKPSRLPSAVPSRNSRMPKMRLFSPASLCAHTHQASITESAE